MLLLSFSALIPGLAQADEVDTLSQRLVALRGEVDELNAALTLQREEQRQQMAALVAQRGEVEAAIKRMARQEAKMRKDLAENREMARKAGADDGELKPVLLQAMSELREQIEGGLPFKRQARMAAVDETRKQMDSGVLSSARAANRLWALYEDELRLTRENGLYRQTITLGDDPVLADVAKLGMVMLYFRTPDERYGMAQQTADGWQYAEITDRADVQRLAQFFASLKKQIRTGLFELPTKG